MNDRKSDSMFSILIPKSRIGVIIGPKGKVKKELEKKGQIKLDIDSETGEVQLIPLSENYDPLLFLKAQYVIKAISRGYTPQKAMFLYNDNYHLEVISLKEMAQASPKKLQRYKSRLIGTNGKARRFIETATKTSIVIMGSTVSIIGKYENLLLAKEAIIMLINGAKHGHVYAMLTDKGKEIKKAEEKIWLDPKESEEQEFLFEEQDLEEEKLIDKAFEKLIEKYDE